MNYSSRLCLHGRHHPTFQAKSWEVRLEQEVYMWNFISPSSFIMWNVGWNCAYKSMLLTYSIPPSSVYNFIQPDSTSQRLRSHLTGIENFPYKQRTKNTNARTKRWGLGSRAGVWDDIVHISQLLRAFFPAQPVVDFNCSGNISSTTHYTAWNSHGSIIHVIISLEHVIVSLENENTESYMLWF